MGGRRGLLGRERLGSGGGCSGVGPPRQSPPPRSPQASSRRVPPHLRVAAISPCSCPLPRSACFCSRNSAPGSSCCSRPLGSARPLPCTLGLGPALQLQAGLLLPTGQITHTRPLPTARPLPDSQARLGVARDLRCWGHHHAPHPTCSL